MSDSPLIHSQRMILARRRHDRTHFGPFRSPTTHVTGTLARLTDELAKFLAVNGSRARHRAKSASHNLRNAAILAGLWISYGVGAGMGVFVKQRDRAGPSSCMGSLDEVLRPILSAPVRITIQGGPNH